MCVCKSLQIRDGQNREGYRHILEETLERLVDASTSFVFGKAVRVDTGRGSRSESSTSRD